MDVLRTLKERCDPKYTALVVVDVQNDFVSRDGSAGKRGEDVSAALAMVPNLARVKKQFPPAYLRPEQPGPRNVGVVNAVVKAMHGNKKVTES